MIECFQLALAKICLWSAALLLSVLAGWKSLKCFAWILPLIERKPVRVVVFGVVVSLGGLCVCISYGGSKTNAPPCGAANPPRLMAGPGAPMVSSSPTNGTYVLTCSTTGGLVRMWNSPNRSRVEDYTHAWPAAEPCAYAAYLEGIEKSRSLGDVTFRLEYRDAADVTRASVEKPLTVIKVGNVILPGEPEGGLVVLRGTSVAMEVECEPAGAGMMLSTVFQTRKLRRRDNGYVLWPVDDDEEWNIAASNNYGSTGIYTPTTGGVYQVRSQVMLQGGSRGLCLAKRIWDTDEDGVLGIKKRGQWRAFGVCDAQWQIQLRNFALSFIGSSDYAFHAVLPAMYGYEEYDAGAYKCSIFVAHTIARANLNPPHRVVLSFQTGSGPSAAEWASEDYQIGHWPLLPLDAAPQPGFVSSTGGHCGILDFDGMGISAQNVFVTRKSELTCAQGRFRAYTQGETQ